MASGARLVGRTHALRQIDAAFDAAFDAAGHGDRRLVLISGEPGIGKTALATAAVERALAQGAVAAWGVAWESDGAPPFWPWVQVLRSLREAGTAAELGAAAHLLPASGSGTVAPSGDAASRFELFEAVASFLRRVASEGGGGLVVVLDDLQWADEPSLLLLEFAARHLAASPVLFVGTYRDVEAGGRLRTLASAAEVVSLGGLDEDGVRALFADLWGAEPAPALVAQVVRRTAGNPLFVRELAHLLRSRPDAPADAIPESVRSVLEGRLARLSPSCLDVLRAASVLGAEVDADLLARVAGPRAELGDALGEAVRAHVLLAPSSPLGAYRFAHDLLREVLEDGLAPQARAEVHQAAGYALQVLAESGAAVHAAQVAVHFAHAAGIGTAAEAVRWSADAAAESAARLAWEDACGHYERALTALELTADATWERRADLLVELGEARDRSGDARGARRAYDDAARLARRAGDAERLGRAALGVHHLGAATGLSRSDHLEMLEEAAAALSGEESGLRARVLAALADNLHHSWTPAGIARAPVVASAAVALARRVGGPSTVAACLLALHDSRWTVGSARARLEVADEMAEVAAKAGERGLEAEAMLLRAAALLELGDVAGRVELREYCRVAASLGHARARWRSLSRRAADALMSGRVEEAEALIEEAYRLGQDIGEPDAYGVWSSQWAILGRFTGRSLEAVERTGIDAHVPMFLGLALAEAGNEEGAERVLAGFTIDSVPHTPDDRYLVIAAEALAVVGSERERARAYDALLPQGGLHVVVGGCVVYAGTVDLRLGVLAHLLGRTDDARRHLEAALRQHEAVGAPGWAELAARELARTQAEGAAGPARPAVPSVPVLQKEHDLWSLTFAGTSVRMRDSKGLRDLAALVSRPGDSVHVLELLGTPRPQPGGADPVLDERARAAYRFRLRSLDEDIEDAEADNDPERAERARAEREALIAELSRAFGLGGRARRLGDEQERARKTVTARVRDALGRIEEQHPSLGRHLRATVQTGAWCSYDPRRVP